MKQTQQGLTLIEVLIALAIVSIAMTAVIKAASQNIKSTAYLQKKTMALWVAEEVINETRAHRLNLGASSGHQRLSTEMLGKDWYWQTNEEATANPRIKKLIVSVYDNERDKEDAAAIITLEGYVYHEA
jgi:general secretion pathway protein I